ncbi:type II secretion system protein GspD [Idiomarina abyssalis]|uniref:Type II/III secretion system secretin-like domain-containing protein n=1 Tax=Idiomarina abyssalis TaxID=86102 RepID=A0A8I1KIB8_9GAMM|nr:hypothetical protein [Idiomarina abyssalis]MBJ7265586.1 hypothetical protein [Idiomarina abyssalis]MBJ7316740.1 hypothetical protein [Idiomarina abyssalis]
MRALTVIASACLVLSGCSALEVDYSEERDTAKTLVTSSKNEAKDPTGSGLDNVYIDDDFYVPELSDEDKERPPWYFEPTEFKYRATPFRMIVNDLFGDYVSTRYLQSIKIDTPVSLSHNGTLGRALKKLGLATGYEFTLEDGVLSWYKYSSKTIDVSYIPGVVSYTMGDGDKARGSSSVGNSSAGLQFVRTGNSADSEGGEAAIKGSYDVAEDFENSVKILLSSEGEYSFNNATGTITVRDIPENVREIESLIHDLNKSINRKVVVDIKVVDVTFTDNKQASVNVNLIRESTGSSIVQTLSSGVLPDTASVLRGTLGLQKVGGSMDGSSVIIDALKEQGIVTTVSKPKIQTTNNIIGVAEDERTQGYLASVATSQIANAGSQNQLIPGEVTTGFRFAVLPRIENEKIIMQLDLLMSTFDGFHEETDGQSKITVPNTRKKKFFLRSWAYDGQTLMISGLSNKKRDVRNDQGFLSQLFGGRRGADTQVTETVLLITPRIVDSEA